jgi:hypothetical protein
MPKNPRTFRRAAAALALAACAAGAVAGDKPDDAAVFERLKSLAGSWTGRMEDPLAGPAVTVRYDITSGGHAVIEQQNAGQGFEMVTVYFLADGKLRATSYSAAGNQPAYKLGDDSTADVIQLEFDGGTGFDADRDGHVHKGEIRFVSPEGIEHRWFHYVGAKEQGVTHWFLERETAAEKKAAAAEK